MTGTWPRLARWLARAVLRLYYRSFRVEGRERIPEGGAALLVANHPNSLLDAAAVLAACPRPVRFAAKATLFRNPVWGFLLRRLDAIPLERPRDSGSDVRRNLDAIERMAQALGEGGCCVVFPEGLSHVDPELKEVRSGPARMALSAEAASEGALGLVVVPLGLSYEPAQAFRGEAVVRVGTPFEVRDLLGLHRREAIRTVQSRIAESIRPLILHLDRVDLAPLVDGVSTLFHEHLVTAKGGARPLSLPEVRKATAVCLNHYLVTDPEAVEGVRRLLARHERLGGRIGVSADAVRIHGRPWRESFAFAGIALTLAAGFPLYVAGLLTCFVPYRTAGRMAERFADREGPSALPMARLVAGLLTFGVWWGVLATLFLSWSESKAVTAAFVASMAAAGLFTRFWATRGRALRARLAALEPVVLRSRAVRRVAELRTELVDSLTRLAQRYETESGEPLLPDTVVRPRRRLPWKRIAAVLLVGLTTWFAAGLRGRESVQLSAAPSPWAQMAPDRAARVIERDASALAGYLETLAQLEKDMARLQQEFESDHRSFYEPTDEIEVRRTLLTYLTCREGLLRIAWFYRDAATSGPGEHAAGGFLLSYTAALELCARGMQFIDTYDGEDDAIRKLNEADPSWGIPAGIYDRIRGYLADTDLLDALAEASRHFEGLRSARAFPDRPPWTLIVRRAEGGGPVVAALSDRLWQYKWDNALTRAEKKSQQKIYVASSAVSTWIGDTRIRKRSSGHGLVTPEQVRWLRGQLRPGDILLERRNWYLSNAFLPGYWPHSAIYVGGPEGIASLGIEDDPRVAPHLAALAAPDPDGHDREVIEAISEGVVFTSLEESIGGADAVCVFRPRIPQEEIAEAVARGLRHHGKPYDFDFDFFSSDRLVCTEVVYQAYQPALEFELVEIMGRRTLPALEFVKRWERELGTGNETLDLVCMLDADENLGEAVPGTADDLKDTLNRPGMTLLQETGGLPMILSPTVLALATMAGASLVLLRRPERP